ncbi:MAG: Ig-like domain-containing protein [Bacteroidales bacterium]|nr:Ig-like domain-containing protein [Bacteroidales bacterium]
MMKALLTPPKCAVAILIASLLSISGFSQNLPYGGTPWSIPGTIQAEDYDTGGEGVAYQDTDASNNGGQYRTGEGVDIENCSEGGYNVGWIVAGEWIEYTVNVITSGTYSLEIRVASDVYGGAFHIEFDGINKTGTLSVPNTRGWQNWRTITASDIDLNAGTQVMRVCMDGTDFNIHEFSFIQVSTDIPVTGIDISPPDINLITGNTQQLSSTIIPSDATNQNVIWNSSDPLIASVNSSGIVTANAEGLVAITVITEDGGYSTICFVSVSGEIFGEDITDIGGTMTSQYTDWPAGEGITNLIDNDLNTKYLTFHASAWVQYQAIGSYIVTGYSISSANDFPYRDPYSWTLQGSNDGSTWITMDNRTDEDFPNRFHTRLFSIDNSTGYVYYRFNMNNNSGDILQLSENELFGIPVPVIIPVTGVDVSPTVANLFVGNTQQLVANISPTDATNQNIYWSSTNSAVASVNSNGLVTANAAGSAIISVTTDDGEYTAACNISVSPVIIPVAGVNLLCPEDLNTDEQYQLVWNILPSNATNRNVSWNSSDPEIIAVNEGGLLTAIAEGSSVITITTDDGRYTATCNVVVAEAVIPVTGVDLDCPSGLNIRDQYQLIWHIYPSNATNQNVIWSSSNTIVATINDSGLLTSNAVGSATITVTTEDGEYTALCVISVTSSTIPVTGVSISPINVNMNIGGTQQMIVHLTPSNATNQNLSWSSSDSEIASVNSNGLVTANAEGETSITVTTEDGGYTASGNVTVSPPIIPVTGINISPTTASLTVDSTQQFSVNIYPENATNQNVSWSSNNSFVASVTSNGLVAAISEGMCTINVTSQDGGYTDNCYVTVTPAFIPVTGINVSPNSTDLIVGNTQQLTASVYPQNATNQNIFWSSSNTSVASVNSAGLVTAIAEGYATITVTAQDGGYSATCYIVITPGNSITSYRIRNRWQNVYLSDGGNLVKYSELPNNPGLVYEWTLENPANGQFEIKNAGTKEYMHIENLYGYTQCTPKTPEWLTSRWFAEQVEGNWINLRNVGQLNQFIHIENMTGFAQHGEILSSSWGAQWVLELVIKNTPTELSSSTIADVNIYPNPASNFFSMEIPKGIESVRIQIIDVTGVKLAEKYADTGLIQLDISEFKSGFYFIKILDGDEIYVSTLIIE